MSWLDRVWYGDASVWQRALATATLAPPSVVFGAVTAFRNRLYDRGWLASTRVEGAQVISVGNLIVGGAGKTPLVIYLAQWAQAAGHRVAVISRGYGRSRTTPVSFDASALPDVALVGDEPRLIARRTGARLYVDRDRVRAALAAARAGADVVILDDGFQHRRLARDVDLVVHVENAGHVLPWGPNREPISGLRRASLVFNGPSADDPAGERVVRAVTGPDAQVLRLDGRQVIALAAIARPARFLATLRAQGAVVVESVFFPDHHRFSAAELARVEALAQRTGALVVTTEKDRERLPSTCQFAVLSIDLVVRSNQHRLATMLGWPLACAPGSSMEEGRA